VLQQNGRRRLVRLGRAGWAVERCSPSALPGVHWQCVVGVDGRAEVDLDVDGGYLRTGFCGGGDAPDDCELVTATGRLTYSRCECCRLLEGTPSPCSRSTCQNP